MRKPQSLNCKKVQELFREIAVRLPKQSKDWTASRGQTLQGSFIGLQGIGVQEFRT